MRAILQRVSSGRVSVAGEVIGAIGPGLVILLGIAQDDTEAEGQRLAKKITHLRIFSDEAGKMNRSALEVGAEILLVSQFTLYADCVKGRRPSYTAAAPPDMAEPLVEAFALALRSLGLTKVATGQFGANMLVEINNDGPVTIMLDTTII